MNCRDARPWLSPYLDSELDQSTTFAVSEHLRNCADCQRRFEAEREIDRRMATRLDAGPMPDDMWREVVRPLRTRRWVGWRVFLPLASAACVSLVALMGWRSPPAASESHWMIAEFLSETDGGQPFGSQAPMANSVPTTIALAAFAELAMGLAGEESLGHAVQLVSIQSVQDAGDEIVEVRLNCCGEPVILRVARRDHPGHLREFTGQEGSRFATFSAGREVALAGRAVGDYVVVGVSRHSVSSLLEAIRTQ